jgi:Protein of unknown function (DUF2950)
MMRITCWLRALRPAVAAVVALTALAACSPAPPGSYSTPEEAVQALGDLAGSGDRKKVEEMFGADAMELFESGDKIADREDALRVKAMIADKVAFVDLDRSTKAAVLGSENWWFPLPLVLKDGRWRFDVAGGREELLNRRIGRNELLVLASLHAYVDAQREYLAGGWAGKPPAYARRFRSSEGARDGLYWPVGEGEPESPLGPLFADAARSRQQETGPQPFHGYYFRILEGQGRNAPGGTRSYLDRKDRLTRGFAAIAWPAKHANSGIMTFQVNQQGIVFQKDLGPATETAVATIDAYDPDESWQPTGD